MSSSNTDFKVVIEDVVLIDGLFLMILTIWKIWLYEKSDYMGNHDILFLFQESCKYMYSW